MRPAAVNLAWPSLVLQRAVWRELARAYGEAVSFPFCPTQIHFGTSRSRSGWRPPAGLFDVDAPRREEGAEHAAPDGSVAPVEERPGVEGRLGRHEACSAIHDALQRSAASPQTKAKSACSAWRPSTPCSNRTLP